MKNDLKQKMLKTWTVQVTQMLEENIAPAIMIGVNDEGNPCTFSSLDKETISKFFSQLLIQLNVNETMKGAINESSRGIEGNLSNKDLEEN